jgi:hypothetical protein
MPILRSTRARPWLDAGAAALVLCALTLVALPGLPAHFDGAITPDRGDTLLNVVFLEWAAHQASLGFPDFWDAPYFFPAQMTFALSDHLVGPALLRLALKRLGFGPAASYNTLLFLSFVATGVAVAWLARRAGLSRPAALFAACAYSFSHFRFVQLSHLQMLWAPFLPLALGTFDRLLDRPSPRRAWPFLASYALHLTGGSYLAYMIHFPLAAIAVARLPKVAFQARRRLAVVLLLASCAAFCAGAAWLAFEPYSRAAELHDMKRPWEYQRDLGATVLTLATPDSTSRLAPFLSRLPQRTEGSLFPGLAVTGLLVAALARVSLQAHLPEESWRRWLVASSVVLVVAAFALGDYLTWTKTDPLSGAAIALRSYKRPFRLLMGGLALLAIALYRKAARRPGSPTASLRRSIGWGAAIALLLCFPLVYLPLSPSLPGLAAMRVPTRFFAIASLGIALAAASSLDLLRRRIGPSRRRFVAPIGAALILLEFAPIPVVWWPLATPAEFPPAYRQIAAIPSVGAVAELPLPDTKHCYVDTLRMYYATAHWKPIVNGCSGHFPETYETLRRSLGFPPTPDDLARLRELGVTHVLLHQANDPRPKREKREFRKWALEQSEAGEGAIRYEDATSLLFELKR